MTGSRDKTSFYRPELDALRFLAFMFVFFHHTFQRQASWYHKFFSNQTLCKLSASAVDAGGFGLCLFFTLSAYLIAELLRREKERTGAVHIKAFYQRRMLRILPLYLLGLSLGVLAAILSQHFRRDIMRLLSGVLMFGNWYAVRNGWNDNPMGHLWSISVEGQFYLFWPLIALRAGKFGLYATCLAMLAAANGWLFYLGFVHANLDYRVWANSFVQFYMFGAGVLLALLLRGRVPRIRLTYRLALFLAALIFWLIASFHFKIKEFGYASSPLQLMAGYSLAAAGCGILLLSVLGSSAKRIPVSVIYLGRISYGLYVYHFLGLGAAEWIGNRYLTFRHHNSFDTLLGLFFTVLLAALSYRYFETPFLKAKNKLEYVRTLPA